MTVFVDSGGWLPAVNKADQRCARGRPYFEGLIRARARILTTDFVLDEVLTRLRYDAGYRMAVEFLELARRSIENGTLAVATLPRRSADGVWRAQTMRRSPAWIGE